jgi:hypothetical protein
VSDGYCVQYSLCSLKQFGPVSNTCLLCTLCELAEVLRLLVCILQQKQNPQILLRHVTASTVSRAKFLEVSTLKNCFFPVTSHYMFRPMWLSSGIPFRSSSLFVCGPIYALVYPIVIGRSCCCVVCVMTAERMTFSISDVQQDATIWYLLRLFLPLDHQKPVCIIRSKKNMKESSEQNVVVMIRVSTFRLFLTPHNFNSCPFWDVSNSNVDQYRFYFIVSPCPSRRFQGNLRSG